MYMESNRFLVDLYCYSSDLGALIAEIDRISDGYVNDRFTVHRLNAAEIDMFDSEVRDFCGCPLGDTEKYLVVNFPSRCLRDCLSLVSSLSYSIGVDDVTKHSFFIRVVELDSDEVSVVTIIKL